MIEPWCWPPHWVDRLTDAEMVRIIEAQNAQVRRWQGKEESFDRVLPDGPVKLPPGEVPEPGRKGAMWEYLTTQCGMTPEQADRVTANQG